MNSIPLPFNS